MGTVAYNKRIKNGHITVCCVSLRSTILANYYLAAYAGVKRQAMLELDRLVGSTLLSLKQESEYLISTFSCGVVCAYNPATVTGKNDNLINRVVESVSYQQGLSFDIILEGGAKIVISLAGNDYSGPEAFCAKFNCGVIVVE